jgi:hypothetical protein
MILNTIVSCGWVASGEWCVGVHPETVGRGDPRRAGKDAGCGGENENVSCEL